MNKGYIMPYDYCPKCGIKIYKPLGETYYRCRLHGNFDRNLITGELEMENKKKGAKGKGGCCDKCKDKGRCTGKPKKGKK